MTTRRPSIPVDDVALSAIRHSLGGALVVEDGEPRFVGADMSLLRLLDFWAGHDESDGHWEDGYTPSGEGRVWVCHQPTFSKECLILALIDEIERMRTEAQ